MAQADGYIRISTLNDTTQAQRSTEQLGDTLASALDTSLADRMTDAVIDLGDALRDAGGSATELGDVQHGIDDVGNSATTTGNLIRTHLISDTVMKGLKQLGSVLKGTAVSAVSGAMGNETAFAKASALLTDKDLEKYLEGLIDISTQSGQIHDLIWDYMSANLKTFDPVANNAGFDYKFSGTYEERERDFEMLYNYLQGMGWEMTEFGRDVLEQWENMRAARDDLANKQKRYEELYGNNDKAVTSGSSWYADYYKNKDATSVKKLSDETKADNEALYKQFGADAKYSYDMGVIDAVEYYSQLAGLRDTYLERDTDEWRSVNVEIKKYYDSLTEEQKKAYEQQLKQQKEAAEQAQRERLASYNEEKSQLQFKQKTGQISEKQYYEELANIRDKYLDKNSSEWRNSFLETYQYNQKIIEANKDALNALLTETSDSTLSALQNIISARDSLTSKLVDFNKTFEKITEAVPETVAVKGEFTVTTAEHEIETYKMGADSIEDNIKILGEYGEMLDALKARGADDGTLNDILAMDVDEAMELGSKMLKMSDREWNGYFDSMARLRETAADISAKYYQSEVDNLKNNFVDRLREELFGLDSDMMSIGAEAALSFIDGWNKELGANDLTLGDMLSSLAGGSYATAPNMSQLLSAFGAQAKPEEATVENGNVTIPIYLGTEKITDIIIDGINSKNIKTGKNVLNT